MLSFVGWQFVGTIIPLNIHNAETATILPTINHNTLSCGLRQYGKLPPCSSSAMKAVCEDLYIVICAVWSKEISTVYIWPQCVCLLNVEVCWCRCDWAGVCQVLIDPGFYSCLSAPSSRLGQTPVRCHPHISTFFSPVALIIANIYPGESFASVAIFSHRIIKNAGL